MPGPSAKAGIGRGIANIGRIIADRRREDEEQERQRALDRLRYDVRPGEPPMRERTLGPGPSVPEPDVDFAPPGGPLTDDPASIGLSAEPEDVLGSADLGAPPVPTATVQEPDPGFVEVPELGGYVMTAEERARREREAAGPEYGVRMVGDMPYRLNVDTGEAEPFAGLPELAEEEESPWELREVGDRLYRINTTAGVAEPIPGVDPEPDTGDGEYTPTDEELRQAGIPEDLIPLARNDPTLRRQLLRDAREGEGDWTPPRFLEGLVENRAEAVNMYGPEVVDYYDQTGEWNPSLGEDGGETAPAMAGPGEGPSWWQRAVGNVANALVPGQPFGKQPAAAQEVPEPEPVGTDTVGTGPGARVPEPDVPPVTGETTEPEPDTEADGAGLETGGEESVALETDIRAAIQEGQTAEEILSELRSVGAPDHIVEQAREILSRLGENIDNTGNEDEGSY